MAEKYVVVKDKVRQTGPLPEETARRVAADIGGGAKVVPVEVKPAVKTQKSPLGIFVIASVIVGGIALVAFDDFSIAVASAIGGFFAMIVAELWMTRTQ
jgi:hypothetical protein